MQQNIVWTALPNGLSPDGTALHLTILVSPRLDTGGPGGPDALLSDFPAFIDWPQHQLDIFLRFDNQPPVQATPLNTLANSALWLALFPPDQTAVRSFDLPDYTQDKINSFPVKHIGSYLRDIYSRVGISSPVDLPSLDDLAATGITGVATIDGDGREWWSIEDDLHKQLLHRFEEAQSPALPPAAADPQMDFFQAKHFHSPSGGQLADPVEVPKLDFHEAVAVLGEHPFLLRRLGLLLDVSVPLDGQPPSAVVRVDHVDHELESGDRSIGVQYDLDANAQRFVAASGPGSDIDGGMLRLASQPFGVEQVDVDGAALKTIQYANQLLMRQRGRRRSRGSGTNDGLPALRTGGISVYRSGRAQRLGMRFAAAVQADGLLAGANPPVLRAEALTRGYRVDVEDDGVWRSLCHRKVRYRIGRLGGAGTALDSNDEEGVVVASAKSDTDPAKKDLFLHESLFHWDGWSLVAPRPGEKIETDGLAHGEDVDNDGYESNPSQTSLELSIAAQPVPGSLPRLRFGRRYRLRARAVDVAGNSLPLESTDDSQATEPLVYRRYEPVEPPAVAIVSQKELSGLPGESAMRMVIRSYNSSASLDALASPEIAERLLLPPRSTVSMIEQYGLLDVAGGVDGSAETWNRLATKDAAQLPERYDDPSNLPQEVPYLADPASAGAVLRSLPGSGGGGGGDGGAGGGGAEGIETVPFDVGADWWRGKPFRLAIVEGSGAPQWNASTRTLTVDVPKAGIARVRLSSTLGAHDLDKMAVWKWIESQAYDEEHRLELESLAKSGVHWMLTPFREITLVHATQQPLASPVITDIDPKKGKIGDTYARVEGSVEVDAASTGKVELLAQWTEPTGYGFARVAGESLAFAVTVEEGAPDGVAWGGGRHELGDTKYRRVDYYARATTRFRDYFDTTLETADLSRPAPGELPPHSDQHLVSAEVLSSARPLAPNLLYVVPTFGWEEGEDELGRYGRRRGGLRLYLEEPWFSSGDGELLGVVVWPGAGDKCVAGTVPQGEQLPEDVEVPDELKPYATMWGRDPIWLSGAVQQVPSLENFARAVAVQLDLSLAEKPAEALGVAGHEVGYDEDRGLFYCDLDVDAGASYFPFVRLALVRYQPKSIRNAELSRVVLAEFAQPAPDRLVWARWEVAAERRLRVVVSGVGYRSNASFACTSEVEARLECWLAGEGGGGGEDAPGWVPVSVEPVLLRNVQALETLGVWEGALEVPEGWGEHVQYRVVVEEWEAFVGDAPGVEVEKGEFGVGRERRLVFSDAVEVNRSLDGSSQNTRPN